MSDLSNYRSPKIVVRPPGPKTRKLIDEALVRPAPGWMELGLIIPKRAEGVWIEDIDGNVFIDFVSGGYVANTGHRHPEIVKAAKRQLDKFICGFSESRLKLADRLARITPGHFKKDVYFGHSGSDSNDTAIELARWSTRRPYIIAFLGAYHGITLGALSMTSTLLQRRGCHPLVPGIITMPYPYCYRCPFRLEHPECELQCLRYIEDYAFKTFCPPHDVAGVNIELIQGDAGWIVPPDDYLPALKKMCEKYAIPFIAEEVQTGFGRTGKIFACEHWDIEPDIICIGKAMGSGIPISACVARAEISQPKDRHEDFYMLQPYGFTLGGNPMSSLAALTTIDIIQKENLTENAARIGEYIIRRLKEIKDKYEIIGDIRGKGLLIGVEIVKDKRTKKPAVKEAENVCKTAYENGLSLAHLGIFNSTIGISPPLVVNKDQADVGLQIFEDALKKHQ